MSETKPYPAVLCVRTAADETASGMSQGEFCDRLYEAMGRPEWRWDRAVLRAAGVTSCPQWAVVSLYSEQYGFGFAYFYASGCAIQPIVMGGLLEGPIVLPMPETYGETGSIMAQRVGVVQCKVTVSDVFEHLKLVASKSGVMPVPVGWSVDWRMIRVQTTNADDRVEVIPLPEHSIPEDN